MRQTSGYREGAVAGVKRQVVYLKVPFSHRCSYRVAAEARRQSVIFLNLKPKEQILVQTRSAERFYEAVYSRAFNIIRRWDEIGPGDEQS